MTAVQHGPSLWAGAPDFEALRDVVRPPAWMLDAACAETPDGDFFPERGCSVTAARLVCARCLVRDECLAYALERGINQGIWGGTSERERRAMKARRSTDAGVA